MIERSPFEAEQSPPGQLVKLGEMTMLSVRDADTHAITLDGEMDLASTRDVEEELFRVEDGDARFILIDLSGLTLVDCAAIRLLSAAGERARTRGEAERLWLLRPPEHVHRVLALAGVGEQLPFAD